MATTFQEAAELVIDEDFKLKVRLGLAYVAREVLAEAGSVPFHDQRVVWARSLFGALEREVNKAVTMLAGVPSVVKTIGDGALINEIRAEVNSFAGASAPGT